VSPPHPPVLFFSGRRPSAGVRLLHPSRRQLFTLITARLCAACHGRFLPPPPAGPRCSTLPCRPSTRLAAPSTCHGLLLPVRLLLRLREVCDSILLCFFPVLLVLLCLCPVLLVLRLLCSALFCWCCGCSVLLSWCFTVLLFAICLLLCAVRLIQLLQFFTMSQISPIVINITLDGSNYPEWSFCVETALRGQGFYSHLIDDLPMCKSNGSNDTDITTWQTNDGKMMTAMVNSIKQSMIMSLKS